MTPDRPTLAIVPLHVRDAEDLDAALRCLVSLRCSAPDAALLVLDDGSPAGSGIDELEVAVEELGGQLVRLDERVGTVAALNVGLSSARDFDFDALLVDPAVEFRSADWLERLRARTDGQGRPAAIVGARLLEGRGLLWHAGFYHSMLRLEWFSRFQWGPGELPEALVPCRCPVGRELALIRHETIAAVGLLDEELGELALLDYCLRTYRAGLDTIYEPSAWAVQLRPGREADAPQPADALTARLNARWPTPTLSSWIPDPL